MRDEFEAFYNWHFLQLDAILHDPYGRVYAITNQLRADTCYCVCYYECKFGYIERGLWVWVCALWTEWRVLISFQRSSCHESCSVIEKHYRFLVLYETCYVKMLLHEKVVRNLCPYTCSQRDSIVGRFYKSHSGCNDFCENAFDLGLLLLDVVNGAKYTFFWADIVRGRATEPLKRLTTWKYICRSHYFFMWA